MAFTAPPAGPSSDDGFTAVGGRLESMKVCAEPGSPDWFDDTTGSSSASSAAGRLRCLPHISSRMSGGEAAIGVSLSTVPSDGVSHARPLLVKPRSNRLAVFAPRTADDFEPSTTAISFLLLRVAVATRLKPDAQMK